MLHRNFFARAILERPEDPTKSIFAPSFLAAYYSSVGVLRLIREHYDDVSHLLMRIWPMWSELLADTLVIGSVAALGSKSPLARGAFSEFDMSIGLFAKAEMHPVAKNGLVNLVLPITTVLLFKSFYFLTLSPSSSVYVIVPFEYSLKMGLTPQASFRPVSKHITITLYQSGHLRKILASLMHSDVYFGEEGKEE